MIFAVVGSKADAICFRSLCGEGSDRGGEPERLAVEDNGGVVDRRGTEYGPILAYRICTVRSIWVTCIEEVSTVNLPVMPG
jgi:hypothetical protein